MSAIVVDARGLRCPLPVIRLAQRCVGLPPGTQVTVLATDPAAEHDIPAWARMRGHRVLDAGEVPDGEGLAMTVEVGGAPCGGSEKSGRPS